MQKYKKGIFYVKSPRPKQAEVRTETGDQCQRVAQCLWRKKSTIGPGLYTKLGPPIHLVSIVSSSKAALNDNGAEMGH